jgi:hypothetical protein
LADPQDGQWSVSATTTTLVSGHERLNRRGYAPGVASETATGTGDRLTPERAWWLRVPGVLVGPRPVFFALREDDPDDVAARSEPLLLVLWMAGAAAVLATPTAAALLDDRDYDAVLLAVWVFIAGGLYGAVGYFFLGFALFFGLRLFGSLGDFGRARHIVGLAFVPMALSLLVLLPARLVLYGGDAFREGGSDEETGQIVLLVLQLAFAAWSLALLVLGVKVVHSWTWIRSVAALAAAAALLAAIVGVFALI